VQVQKERIEQLRQQFEIGKYIREQYHRNIPKDRVDFLLTLSQAGKELESYGYSSLRINQFSLLPRRPDQTRLDVLNEMLTKTFA